MLPGVPLARSVPGRGLMLPGGRPGARSVPGLWLMSPGCALASVRLVVRELCAPGRLPWLMADASRCCPWLVPFLVVV